MSHKYPCIYYDNAKCQKFSDEKYNAWCDFELCEHQVRSNGDMVRAMSDEELTRFHYSGAKHCAAPEPTKCDKHDCVNGLSPCEQCYLEWLKRPAEENT